MKRSATLLAAAIVTLIAGLSLATNSFALSPTTPSWQSGNTHIATPTYGAGAIARPIQNGTMWNLYGLYRAPTGIYYSPRTGAMCPGQPSAACF